MASRKIGAFLAVLLSANVAAVWAQSAARKSSGGSAMQSAAVADSSSAPAGTAAAQAVVPRLIKFSGVLHDLTGKPLSGPVDVTFSLYTDEAGGAELWFETQTVQADGRGNYTALLGAMSPSGVPMELFTFGEAHWLGVQVANFPEQSRVLLVSVPYAMKAGDAETLGGKPASAFLLATQSNSQAAAAATAATLAGLSKFGTTTTTTAESPVSNATTASYIPVYTDSIGTTANSVMYQLGNQIGINTTSPAFGLDLNSNVFAVGTKTAAPGAGGTMRFRDDTGTVRWLFGVPGNAGSQDFFMYNYTNGHAPIFIQNGAGSYSFYMSNNGNVGIGMTNPGSKLDVNGTANISGALTLPTGVSGNLKINGLGNALIFPDGSVMTSAGAGSNGGTITGVTAGSGLAGGGTSGGVVLSIASNSCSAGQVMTGLPLSCSSAFASLGSNTFVGNQGVTGNVTASGSLNGGSASITGGVSAATGSFLTSSATQTLYVENTGSGTALSAFADSAHIGIFSTANATNGVAIEGAINGTVSSPSRPTGLIGINGSSTGIGLSGIINTSDGTAGLFQSTTAGGQILSGRAGGTGGSFGTGTEVFSVSYTGAVKGTTMVPSLNGVAFSATPTFDASLGNTVKITLTANVTSSTLSNATAGQTLNFVICQDATGGRTFVWPTNVLGGMTIGSTASKCSAQSFVFDGTNAYALSAGASNM